MTRIKICGITEVEHALALAALGANFLGMVFSINSRRQIDTNRAAEIVHNIRSSGKHLETVGVFVNSPAQEVNRIVAECPLDWAQLSGDETWEYCLDIEKPVIKVLHISRESSAYVVLKQIEEGYRILGGKKVICLLDTLVEGSFGGTGQNFNWELAREVALLYPVIIAGGLTPDNVGRLVNKAQPWGVDVSSGVETGGVKDKQKIKDFIQAVKSIERRT